MPASIERLRREPVAALHARRARRDLGDAPGDHRYRIEARAVLIVVRRAVAPGRWGAVARGSRSRITGGWHARRRLTPSMGVARPIDAALPSQRSNARPNTAPRRPALTRHAFHPQLGDIVTDRSRQLARKFSIPDGEGHTGFTSSRIARQSSSRVHADQRLARATGVFTGRRTGAAGVEDSRAKMRISRGVDDA